MSVNSSVVKSVETTKRINELDSLPKLTGKEYTVVGNTEKDFKVTVDALMGYIAAQINKGTIGEGAFGGGGSNIIDMPIGEEIPVASREKGNFYLRQCDVHDAQIAAGIPMNIRVGANMGLRIIDD